MWQFKGYDLPGDLLLLVWVGVLVLYFEILVRLRPLPRILHNINASMTRSCHNMARPPTNEQLKIMDKIYRGATFWMTRVGRSPRPCLRRSLVLYHWCALQGVEARVVVGVRKDGSDLKGHGWLLLDGQPYHEAIEVLEQYTVFIEG